MLNVTRPVSPCSVPGIPLYDEEIIEAIRKLKNGKATAQSLKAAPPELVDWLIEIIQLIWKTGKVPHGKIQF